MLFRRKKEDSKDEEINEFIDEVKEKKLIEEKDKVKAINETNETLEIIDDEKPDLFDYLDSLDDDEDSIKFSDMVIEEEVVEERTEAQILADYIRERSNAGYLTKKSDLKAQNEKLEEILDSLQEDETCQDIVYTEGEEEIYFYSNEYMTENYAMIALLIEEKDMPKTIAEMVRWNGKTYPCATPVYYFQKPPYNYTEPQINRALQIIKKEEEYSDICELTTGNNVRYLYSTLHMSEKYARALAESVEYGEYGYR